MEYLEIQHVQLAMPPEQEAGARDFYAGILGLREVPKPAALRSRGGAWFESGSVRLHLGVEADFTPARKAHPALLVSSLDAVVELCQRHGIECVPGDPIEGFHRVHLHDPFGNRLEFMELAES